MSETLDLDADAAPLLHAACRRGDVADVRRILLAHGSALLNSTDGAGATPLNHAAYHGHRRVAEFLLAAGATPTADATDDAVRGGHLSLATWINAKAAHAAREREVAELAAKRERLAEVRRRRHAIRRDSAQFSDAPTTTISQVAERKAEYARLQRERERQHRGQQLALQAQRGADFQVQEEARQAARDARRATKHRREAENYKRKRALVADELARNLATKAAVEAKNDRQRQAVAEHAIQMEAQRRAVYEANREPPPWTLGGGFHKEAASSPSSVEAAAAAAGGRSQLGSSTASLPRLRPESARRERLEREGAERKARRAAQAAADGAARSAAAAARFEAHARRRAAVSW